MIKKLTAVLLVLALALSMTACGCEHEWADANCVDPKTCTLCGETEGAANGHVWLAATCEAPKTCEVCGSTDGEPKGHSMVEANCEEAAHCENCSLTEGEALGHVWLEATTDAPQTCETCSATEGEPIITDPRFTTASTADLHGRWAMEMTLTGEMMGISDFTGEATINFILTFGNAGDLAFSVEITEAFTDALIQYTVDSIYAEFAVEGMDKAAADEAFALAYGMSIQDYVAEEMAAVDLNTMYASIFEAAGLSGVYYVADGLLYTGNSWDEELESSEYTLDGDTLVIEALTQALTQELGMDGTWVRMTEE